MNVGEIVNGAKALLDGFGERPPEQEVAQNRADICTGRGNKRGKDGKDLPCKANYLGGWAVTTEIARAIHAQREKKLELKLSVEGEHLLGTCEVCRCHLPLKVFYSSQTIRSHTTDATFEKMREANPQCWIAALQHQHDQKS